ncbi:hypothetical protein CgS9114_02293 [Corynebacterium glutamicum S9114]|nr:hypothetical protein CgS9114_02293 [Corynebacterium glutamicum S9114]NII88217.1 hypothetical protein [Corynebacterium glutamicum]
MPLTDDPRNGNADYDDHEDGFDNNGGNNDD